MSRNLIFLHIPKAAGTTLQSIIRRQYPDRQIYNIKSGSESLQKKINDFKSNNKSERKNIRFLTGHGVFGLHEYLYGSTEYVTMFRNPVSRVISNYYYVRRSPEHRLHEDVVEGEMSLREYVTSGVNEALDNQMVRNVAGTSRRASKETLEEAKKNLSQFFGVVGLVERFDESILVMKKHFGWWDVSYQKKNVSSNRPRKEEIPKSVREEIKDRNKLDIDLYKYAKVRLNRKIRRIDIDRKLRILRLQCRMRSLKAGIRSLSTKMEGKIKRGLSTMGLR